MPLTLIERYLLRDFVFLFVASLLVLAMVSLGGIVADLLSEIARGKLPATLLLSQLGLRVLAFLPLVLPLALFLGLLLAVGRLYRDSEMAVLASVGLGPRQLLRPLMMLAVPVAVLIAVCSLWAAPAALGASQRMIDEANRSLLVAGLEPGRFVELPGIGGVLFVRTLAEDGTRFGGMFLYTERDGRFDVTTAQRGELQLDGGEQRFVQLHDGYRSEGALDALDYRMMRYERNELQLPDRAENVVRSPIEARSTIGLLLDDEPEARAELHWRLASPLAALVLALMALPLARTEPRQPRYGQLMVAVLLYLLYIFSLTIARAWLGQETLPAWMGAWWVHAPALALALWLVHSDGRVRAPGRVRA